MNRYNLLGIIAIFLIFGCKSAYERENGEIESLNQQLNNTEELLTSVDTAKLFSTARTMRKELFAFSTKYDTLSKDDALKVADYYGNKKSIYFVNDNYGKFFSEIETSRKQLENLKNDLNNGIITKEKFAEYFINEQKIIVQLNTKISNSIGGIGPSIDKMIKNREEIMQVLGKYRLDKTQE